MTPKQIYKDWKAYQALIKNEVRMGRLTYGRAMQLLLDKGEEVLDSLKMPEEVIPEELTSEEEDNMYQAVVYN